MQVDLLALLISVLAPVAIVLLVLGKRTTFGMVGAILVLIVSFFYQRSAGGPGTAAAGEGEAIILD